ncbi:CheR family methyltransferase [Deltaproteobacteria bacterium TL4]
MLTDSEIQSIYDLIKKETGIHFEQDHYLSVKRHVSKRMSELHLNSNDYLHLVSTQFPKKELSHLLSLMINHSTLFFRDFEQLLCFAEECLPEVKSRKQEAGSNVFKIWSAGCSTGEEAYTLAIILNVLLEEEVWDYKIYATDLDEEALKFARKGLYQLHTNSSIPPEYLEIYFERKGDGFQVHPVLGQDIIFRKLNLIDPQQMQQMSNFDFIFCKNVLFYFDERTQEIILQNFNRALNRGGFLFLDYAQTTDNFMKKISVFKKEKYFYRKQLYV